MASALRQACAATDLTQERIAEDLGVHQTTVSKWFLGKAWPPLAVLPTLDALCGQPTGHILRLAGFVADHVDVVAAIATDPYIDDDAKGALQHMYGYARRTKAQAEGQTRAEAPAWVNNAEQATAATDTNESA